MLRRTISGVVEKLPLRFSLSVKAHHYARLLSHDLLDRDFDLRGIRVLVRPGETVVDVGANVGIWTHHLSRLVGSGGREWSVEPTPETFALLRINIERFNLGNVITSDRAVSDEDGSVSMSVPKDARGFRNYHLAQIGVSSNSPSFKIQSVFIPRNPGQHRPELLFLRTEHLLTRDRALSA